MWYVFVHFIKIALAINTGVSLINLGLDCVCNAFMLLLS